MELAKSFNGNNRLFEARKVMDFEVEESEKNKKEEILSELEKDRVVKVRLAVVKRTKND